MNRKLIIDQSCFHCGNIVKDKNNFINDKLFCCSGCKMVYEILNENDLCTYYELNQKPGVYQERSTRKDKYAFLENPEIQSKLIQYSDKNHTHVSFYIPQIHCSSCLWLLENIQKINDDIISSRVNFTKKEVFLVYNSKASLRSIVETLERIGYEPYLSLNELTSKAQIRTDRKYLYKIGVAGFCFANIMMISLADYFVTYNVVEPKIALVFKIITLTLSLPVLFYSATEFFTTAWYGLKNKYLNIDLPVALALIITFIRSLYEINSGTGNGYLDSMSGIVFFMLIGRWLQSRTYQTISFDRDYKSFFPIALNVIRDGKVSSVEVSEIKENDIIQIHSNEIIPVDAILSKGNASIDYSFVTGESLPVQVEIGEMVYAGGKQLNGLLELLVIKEVSHAYLTNLWNNQVFKKVDKPAKNDYDNIGKYFTIAVLILGFAAGIYWYLKSENTLMWNAITTVLIVACPCALLLSNNFTNGNILRILGLNKFYLRSPEIIERLANIQHIVLDKTGTITQVKDANVRYSGKVLDQNTKTIIASLLSHSSHPVSKHILHYLNMNEFIEVKSFKEIPGKGIEGWVDDKHVRIGSSEFTGKLSDFSNKGTSVVININNEIIGEFTLSNKYRIGISKLLSALKQKFTLSLLSGDNDSELKNIEELIGKDSEILFNQSPQQKLDYIKNLQSEHNLKVLMVGDGLNDAGALKQSDVGIAVSNSGNNFTPSSDGIIDANSINKLGLFIQFARNGKRIILFTFCISVLYNIIGLYYAVQGILSPVIAAILMPSSSISIILLTYGLTQFIAKKYQINNIENSKSTTL